MNDDFEEFVWDHIIDTVLTIDEMHDIFCMLCMGCEL